MTYWAKPQQDEDYSGLIEDPFVEFVLAGAGLGPDDLRTAAKTTRDRPRITAQTVLDAARSIA